MFKGDRKNKKSVWERICGTPLFNNRQHKKEGEDGYTEEGVIYSISGDLDDVSLVRDYSHTPLRKSHGAPVGGRVDGIRPRQFRDKQALPHEVFYLIDGKKLVSIHDLIVALKEMEDRHFEHHAQGEWNDFSNWIGDVFGDHECAKEISRARDRHETRAILNVYFD